MNRVLTNIHGAAAMMYDGGRVYDWVCVIPHNDSNMLSSPSVRIIFIGPR